MNPKPNQTIADIARLAGVSKSTVSRALNNSSLINPKTRERIQAIARQHQFRINASARSLSLRQSRTIAFVAPAYTPEFLSGEDLFGMTILGGIGQGLRSLGYDLLVVFPQAHDETWAHDTLAGGRVDGLILMPANLHPRQVEALVELGTPFIGWGSPLPYLNHCTVTGDHFSGGQLAARRLVDIGRRRIAFLGGPEHSLTVQLRLRGCQAALQAAGHSLDPDLVVFGDYSHASGAAAMQRLVDQAPGPDAVFVNSDLMALGAVQAALQRGKRVPQDIAVVGYDDLPIAAYCSPPLTTIRQDLALAGRLLAQNLVHHIQTGEITHVTLPVELVIRSSA